jgi:Protein affecting phage T7 exclusion by the F plasmid
MLKILLFLVYPFLEIYLLIEVGAAIGALNMILWIFLSALFGFWYPRMRSQYSMMQMRTDLAAGKMPQSALMDSVLISVGGLLLILPGLISDAVGLLLFLPPARHLISKNIQKHFKNRAGSSTAYIFTNTTGFGPGRPQDDLHGQGSVFDADAQSSQGEDEQAPRQATVIDSTAITIEPTASGQSGTKNNGHADS